LTQWPENFYAFTKPGSQRIQTISKMLQSVVMKFFEHAEVPFAQVREEWESYASSKVSLKVHSLQFIILLGEGRSSGITLHSLEECQVKNAFIRLWFHLYRI
jgi:hypothetical protein